MYYIVVFINFSTDSSSVGLVSAKHVMCNYCRIMNFEYIDR